MIAYKFLRAGAIGPFSGFSWPLPEGGEPGPWVNAEQPLQACGNGVHACELRHLPYWIGEVLWTIELREPVLAEGTTLVSDGGRLLGRVAAWTRNIRLEFAQACAWRARDWATAELRELGLEREGEEIASSPELSAMRTAAARIAHDAPEPASAAAGYAADAASYALEGSAHLAAFVAAHTAAHSGGDAERAFASEREWQADWLAERLGLLSLTG